MEQIQLIQITPEQLQQTIKDCLKPQLDELKKDFQPKEPTEYLERKEVAKLLNVSLSTLWSWTKKGILKSYGIERRLYYKRQEVENVLIELKK